MLKPEKLSANHEELFLQRYTILRSSALRLTGNDPEQAEDLLHDAFIHFSIHHPPLEEIKNLDGYLYAMLRNLHLSQSRRAARSAHGHFLIIDYDSAEIGLQALDPREKIKVQDELKSICEYACLRKESSRAGSVLILRFFHGYYPDEIVQVTRCTRSAVDHHLRAARSEAKVYLQNPNALSFMQQRVGGQAHLNFGDPQASILLNLRYAIFHTERQPCLTTKQIAELYEGEATESLDAQTLGHIVSCSSCLDKVNKLLGLPALAERDAEDFLGPNRKSKGGGGGDSGGGGNPIAAFAKKSRRRMRQVLKHAPQELHISVNGFILGSQKIRSEVSELTLNVNLDEKIGFVEVFSESDIRLFFQNIELPPEGAVEQPSRIELSDGRSLEVALNFSDTWPKLYVVYHDPSLAGSEIAEVQSSPKSPKSQVQSPRKDQVRLHWFRNIGRRLSDFRLSTFDFGLFLRPATVTAVLAAFLLAGMLFMRLRGPDAPASAADLLRQSSMAEQALIARSDSVVHRTINLEERRLKADGSASEGARVVSRRRLELWESGAQKMRALRVFDEQNRLVNGEWTKNGESRTLSHHGAKLRSEPAKASMDALLSTDIWKMRLSATEFSAIVGDGKEISVDDVGYVSVRETGNQYLFEYQHISSRPGLQRATLILNRPELRAIEMTLVVMSETKDIEPRTTNHEQNSNRQLAVGNWQWTEYRFTESSFEQRATSSVAPAVFEPDPDLLVDAERGGDRGAENIPASSLPAVLVSTVAATAELEVEVLRLLNQVSALSGEQISMMRTPDGKLSVQGVVDTESRKREILDSLSPVIGNPAVHVDIVTPAEPRKRERSKSSSLSSSVSIEGVSPARDTIPVDAEVRRFFSEQGIANERVDEEIRQFSRKVMNRSRRIRLHALALKQIVERFSTADLQGLDPAARAKWKAMVGEHARGFQQEAASLRRDLELIFPSASSAAGAGTSIVISDERELAQAVTRLYALASACDEDVSLSFSIAANHSAAPVKASQFWRSLKSAEQLAKKIANSR